MAAQDTDQNLDVDFSNVTVLETRDLENSWREAPRMWGHSKHRLAPYVGGFPPALAHFFIRWGSEPGETIFDPFCGGGTTPLEAAITGRRGIGNDAFRYAWTVSAGKCFQPDEDEFTSYLDELFKEAKKVDNTDQKLLDHEDIPIFFSDYTLDKILRLRSVLSNRSGALAEYVRALVCGILHGPSDLYLSLQTKDTYSGSADYVEKYVQENDLEYPKRDVRPRIERKHDRIHSDGRIPKLNQHTSVLQSDAANVDIADGSVDFILTSPPYLRVLDYTWNNWLRLWWLEENRKEERDQLDLTSSVEKYRNFIRPCLEEMYRVLDDDGVAAIVVGDVKKNLADGPRIVNTARIIAEEAIGNTGFEIDQVIIDDYELENRNYVVFNKQKYDYSDADDKSSAPVDRCLILRKGDAGLEEPPTPDWSVDPILNP